MRVYLASRYSRREELCSYRADLERLGHTVTSRWLNGAHQVSDAGLSEEGSPEERERFAREDFADLVIADLCISFTEPPRTNGIRPQRNPGPGEIEEWKNVPDCRLGYEISSFGRVRNRAGDFVVGHMVHGYRRVRPNGKHDPEKAIHQLVADLFMGPCPEGYEIDHIDGYKTNNWVGNLEYVTHAENVRRAETLDLRGSRAGTDNGRAKLNWNDVATIRERLNDHESKAAIARDYGVTDVLIGHIHRGKLWKYPPEDTNRGARHVEFGMALGCMKRVWVVGPRENVFHCLEDVHVFEDWQACRAALEAEAAR